MNKKTKFLTHSAIIAALYVVLTLVSALFGLSSGAIQVRISEALTILPVFTPAAIPGLFIGCIISNILVDAVILNVAFGSLATLIGAILTRALRNISPYIAIIPPILSNMLIVPYIIIKAYGSADSYFFLMLTVGIGEIISCGVFGMILNKALRNTNIKF